MYPLYLSAPVPVSVPELNEKYNVRTVNARGGLSLIRCKPGELNCTYR